MKTIRGKIILFFILCLAFAGVLTSLYYENAFSLRRKIYTIERFDDLLNDVLELRRYEKNFILYRDRESLDEGLDYLAKVSAGFETLRADIVTVVGPEQCKTFELNLEKYKESLAAIMALETRENSQVHEEALRTEGKRLLDFSQSLIREKRRRIDQALQRVLIIPLGSMGSLLILVVVLFRFVNRGILRPMWLVKKATEQVANDTFTPISYDKDKQDEITRLMASFNKMVAELDSRQEQLVQSRKMASIGTFTSGIAHELNNPLNNISITAETFQLNYPGMSEKEIRELIDDILTQADRASQVVKNLLEFSRTERPYLTNLDIREVLERTLDLIKNQLIVAHIRIEKEIVPNLPAIRGKRQDLQQAFVNILLNAVQAMPDGGTIIIKADRGPQGYLRTDLADTGTGIKSEDLEHIFDPFFTTKESGQGTGLGLSLVYSIIRTHGGYIEVKSEVDRGTTFSIFLPIYTVKEETADERQVSDRR